MFGHQIKDIEDMTLEASKSANVEQSIHEYEQFDAMKMDAKDDGCLVAVAHDEAKDSVLDHKLPVAACVADSQTKPSCDAFAAAQALTFAKDPAVVTADDDVDAAVPSQVLSAGFFATELNGSMEGIELIDALAADDGSVRVVDVSACLSDIASAKLCLDVLPRENDAASDITDAKAKLTQEWLNHNMAWISKVMMPKRGETIWNATKHVGNSFDDAFGVGVASLTSLALDDRAVELDISALISTQEPSAGAADTQNTDAQSLQGTCLASDATTLATSNVLLSSDDSTAAEDDAFAYSDADAGVCDATDALALVEVDSIHLRDGDGAALNHGCDEPIANAIAERDALAAVAANASNAANTINVANVAANESEVLSNGASVAAVKAASDAVSSFASSAAVGGFSDAGADTDAVEVDCCGVALDVVAAALSHASHEGSDICGLTINGCAKIWSESNSYFFERGSNLGPLETMSVGERLDYLLDSFSYEIDPYSIKALDSAIALVHNRRSMMRSCEESNYVLLKNLGLSDVKIQDLLSVLHLEENYSTGAYLLGVCDDELEFKEALKHYSLDTLITDPEFEKAMLDKLLLWNKADERQLNKNARLQTTINKIYSAMDRRCGGRFKLRDQRFIAEMAIIFLSFAHDISKIRTDLDIRAANGLKYEPYQSLTDFIAETKTPYLLLRHLLGRKDDHHKIGLSYGVDMLARYCYNTEKLVSQLFDIRMEINDFSSPLAEIVIKKGDRGSCCTAATTLSSNAEMLRVMAKESAAMRLRISQLNAILQADIEDNVNLLRDRTFERLIKANPIPELQLNSVADLSTENGTSSSSLDGIKARANGASTPSGANANKDAAIVAVSESKTFTAAAGDGDGDADADADADAVEAKSKASVSECLDDGACADACTDAHADTHDDTGADSVSDTDSGADEAADGNCVLHAPKNFSCLKEMERRQRYGNCLFTNLNKEPQRTICTLSSLMYASALAEYERRIHSVNETYSDIYVSDNTMYISTSSRAHASLLFGMNLLTYQDLQTSLEWDGKLVHEIIVRNGLSFRRGHNYHLTECEGNTVIFRGFTLRVDEQPIYPQLKVRQLANNDTLLNQLVGSIALYIAARHEQQNYLIEHRKMLLRIFELMAALSRRERVRLLARLDDVSYERYKLLEHSLNIFESINLVSTQKIATSLHANDPLAKAIEQGPQHLLELMRKYPVNNHCAIDAMAGNASLNSFGTATTAAGTNSSNLSSNAANASASASGSGIASASDAAHAANRANYDGATCSMVEGIEHGCGDAGSLKSAWFELVNEYEQRCMGVDIPALVQAFNLERKSIAVNSTEAVVFREVLGLGVAIMIGASHADDDIFKASKRHVVTGGFDYRNMKMRGLSLIELENSHLKDFDPLNLPNYMDYELKPSRMVINGCTLSDVLHSAEHYKQQVTVTFENGSKALNDVLCSRQSKAKKLKKQLEQCPV